MLSEWLSSRQIVKPNHLRQMVKRSKMRVNSNLGRLCELCGKDWGF
jgi:hypothetical protein